jgi:hypothetical protein
MALVCPRCRTIHRDPGGDSALYGCSICGWAGLARIQSPAANRDAIVGGIAGAAIGAAFFGPAGALFGALLGGAVGTHKSTPRRST